MMTQLLKHEMRRYLKQILPVWLILIASAGLTHLLQRSGIPVLMNIGDFTMIFTVLMAIVSMLAPVVLSWHRFYRRNFEPEAYVLHSLPVTETKIWWSFVLTGALYLAASVLLAAGSAWIMDAELTIWLADGFGHEFNIDGSAFALLLVIQLWLQIWLYQLCGFFGMACGLKHADSRLGWSVLWGIVTYGILMILLVLGAFGIGGSLGLDLFSAADPAPEQFGQLLLILMAGYGLADLLLAVTGASVYGRGYDAE